MPPPHSIPISPQEQSRILGVAWICQVGLHSHEWTEMCSHELFVWDFTLQERTEIFSFDFFVFFLYFVRSISFFTGPANASCDLPTSVDMTSRKSILLISANSLQANERFSKSWDQRSIRTIQAKLHGHDPVSQYHVADRNRDYFTGYCGCEVQHLVWINQYTCTIYRLQWHKHLNYFKRKHDDQQLCIQIASNSIWLTR